MNYRNHVSIIKPQWNMSSEYYESIKTATFLPTVIFIIIIVASYTLLVSPFTLAIRQASLLIIPSSSLQSAYGQKVPGGASCNCILDYTASGHLNSNITGITIPKVNLLKNQILQGQTGQGRQISITAHPTQLLSLIHI